MHSEIETISNRMTHQGEKGRNNELVLAEFLEKHLPKRYTVSTGKVVAVGGQESTQVDLIVHDRLNTPAFHIAKAWSLVPVETVCAVISVKTTLTRSELKDAIQSIQSVRALPRKAAFDLQGNKRVAIDEAKLLRSRAFVFAFKSSWVDANAAKKALTELLETIDDDLRPNGVCILDQCIMARKPFTTQLNTRTEHVLMHFFTFLLRAIDDFPKHNVDLYRYFAEDYENA